MVNLGRPPLSPNKAYRWPFNYHEYSNPYAHVKVFKFAIKAYSEIGDAKIVNLFIFTFSDIV